MNPADPPELLTPTLYFDRHFEIEAAKILPGEFYVTNRDMLIVTVLGSCVSACIRDRSLGIGGMNHFMLPENQRDGDNPLSVSTRYGTHAMEMLINQLLKLGSQRRHLEAKVFGGGAVLRGFTTTHVGQRNASFVRQYLAMEGIPILAEDLLDLHPRKVYFFPRTGRVLVKKLLSVHNDTIVQRERDYNLRIQTAPVEGQAELF